MNEFAIEEHLLLCECDGYPSIHPICISVRCRTSPARRSEGTAEHFLLSKSRAALHRHLKWPERHDSFVFISKKPVKVVPTPNANVKEPMKTVIEVLGSSL
jgi:hypothetical protein